MRKSLNILFTALITLSLAMTGYAAEMAAPAGAAQTQTASGVVNLNTADVSQLALLPRVGVKAAQRIVDYRTQHGPFKKPSDLMQVKGFGEKTFNRISAYLTVDGKTTLNAKVSSPRKSRSSKPRTATAHSRKAASSNATEATPSR